jgi:mannosyltransferase
MRNVSTSDVVIPGQLRDASRLTVRQDVLDRVANAILTRLLPFVAVSASLAAGLVIIVYFLFPLSLRLDEAQSLWQINRSVPDIFEVVGKDVHTPLYHAMLHAWTVFFGSDITVLRALSTLFYALSVPACYLFARQLLARKSAAFVTTLFALNPFILWYASEARMYTVLTFLALINQYFFMRIMRHNKGWLGFSLSTLAGIYTHYFFWFGLLMQGLFFLTHRKLFPRGATKKFIRLALLTVLSFLPWTIYVQSLGALGTTSPQLAKPTTIDGFNVYSQFLFGFQGDHFTSLLLSAWPLLVLIAFLIVNNTRQRVSNRLIAYMIYLAFGPLVIAFIASNVVKPFFLSRYMITLLAPLLVLIGWLVTQLPRNLTRAGGMILLIITLSVSVITLRHPGNTLHEDYKAIALELQTRATTQDIVVVSPPFTIYPLEHYYQGPARIVTFPNWDRVGTIPAYSPQRAPAELATLRRDHQYIHLVLSHSQGYEKELKTFLDYRLEKTFEKTYSPGLRLLTYRVGYHQVPPLYTQAVTP